MNISEQLQNYKDIKLSESNREIVRDALEMYRNKVTERLYSDIGTNYTNYHDIMILEIDEILEVLGVEDDEI
jgi:ribosomal protein L20A (L18A)